MLESEVVPRNYREKRNTINEKPGNVNMELEAE